MQKSEHPLRSLLRHCVPDEKRPFSNHSNLRHVFSTVQNDKLLSEWIPQPVGEDLVDDWKSVVDLWVHRLLTLASSNLPDKCCAGILLLGLTCQECSSERFLASYSEWLTKLLSHIQPAAASHFVKEASLASISDLFTRLGRFSNAKKDGTSLATKVVQLAVNLLNNEDNSDVVLVVQRHYDSVEAAIASKLVSGKCCASLLESTLQKLGHGLSLLPGSKGDEDSWSLLMDKILLYINSQLNDALQGLEEETRSAQTMRALLPPGKESPPLLGGLAASDQISGPSNMRPERLLGIRISTLMQCCCNMLTNSYPVMVRVPISGILALIARVLMVDGSSSDSYSFMSTMKKELICSEIRLLHEHSLEILIAVVKGLDSQLLPHIASFVQLLKEYWRRCKLPVPRLKTYSLARALLMSMGVGFAIHIGQDIVSNVFIDLDFHGAEKDGKNSDLQTKILADLSSESHKKKRKHSSTKRSFKEQLAYDGMEMEMSHNLTPIPVKIAALEALEALLIVGGSMRSESWRGDVDRLVITVATNAFRWDWSSDFKLAALQPLLASLLSPVSDYQSHLLSSHLALGRELFRRGAQERGTKLGDFCEHALKVLENPQSFPLVDLQSSAGEYKVLSHRLGKSPPGGEIEDSCLDQSWVTKKQRYDPSPEELPSVKDASITLPEKTVTKVSASVPNHNTTIHDDNMVESPRLRHAGAESSTRAFESVESEPLPNTSALVEDNNLMTESNGIFEVRQGVASTSEHVLETDNDRLSATVDRISSNLLNSDPSRGQIFDEENELADDSLPDIVDGDPDSD